METMIGGIIIGAVAASFAPSILSGVMNVVEPVAKGVIKGGIVVYDTVAEAVSGTSESLKEMVDEARAELEESKGATGKGSKKISHAS